MRRAIGALALLLAAQGCVQEMEFTWRPGSGAPKVCSPGEQRACPYSGPEETNGVGICKAAVMTCSADGSGFGPCDGGEVTPQVEDCATPEDDDCDGLTPACDGSCVWSRTFGDLDTQEGTSIAVDAASGDVVVAGSFSGTVDFGGGPMTSAGPSVFLMKLGGDGSHTWSYAFGSPSGVLRTALALDTRGSLYAAGSFQDSLDFGSGPLAGNGGWDVFAAKRGADGGPWWSFGFGDSAYQGTRTVAVDESQNMIFAGEFSGTVSFGGAPLTSGGGFDAFVAKLDTSGSHIWSTRFGGAEPQVAQALAVDTAGNVLVAGTFAGTVDFGGGWLTSQGDLDVFVVKIDASGAHVWSRSFGNEKEQMIHDIAIDSTGDAVVMTGSFSGPLDFGGGSLAGDDSANMFAVKLAASDGSHIWSRRFGDSAYHVPMTRAAITKTGNVLLAGGFMGSVDFGGGPLATLGDDVFVAKLGADGSHIWSKRFGDPDNQVRTQWATSVAVNSTEDVFLTGFFEGSVDFGCGPHTSAGDWDAFVVRLSP